MVCVSPLPAVPTVFVRTHTVGTAENSPVSVCVCANTRTHWAISVSERSVAQRSDTSSNACCLRLSCNCAQWVGGLLTLYAPRVVSEQVLNASVDLVLPSMKYCRQ